MHSRALYHLKIKSFGGLGTNLLHWCKKDETNSIYFCKLNRKMHFCIQTINWLILQDHLYFNDFICVTCRNSLLYSIHLSFLSITMYYRNVLKKTWIFLFLSKSCDESKIVSDTKYLQQKRTVNLDNWCNFFQSTI